MRIGLSVYGTVFSMGISPASGRPTITPKHLMDTALAAQLTGVELPTSVVEGEDIASLARYAEEHHLFVTLAASGYNADTLSTSLDLGARLGARTVRTVIGGAKLGGDRRPLTGYWQTFLHEVRSGLQAATVKAEQVGVNLAVENHQDVTSEELLWLCETIHSPYFGITLDTGNPLATAEVPLDFARNVAPYVKNVHLKDYKIYLSDEGYYLVRTPLGQGVIDFPALMGILKEQCPDVPMSVELGALEARHIRVLASDYWPEYPSRSAAQFAELMRFVLSRATPTADWRTPYERKESVDAIIVYEERELAKSLTYLKQLQPLLF